MMLAEPQPTHYDLNFRFLGYDVRVTPWFWLMSLILGFSISQPEFVEYATGQPTDLPTPIFLMLWTAAIFISILIHELGHAIAFKHYGVSSHIVLWHFGGIAVPDSMHSHTARIDPRQQLVISLAGPFAQFMIAGVVLLLAFSAGHAAPVVKGSMMDWEFLRWGDPIPNPIIFIFALYLLLPSVFWAAMNLLPVLPLDGGQVARSLLSMHDPYTGIVNSIKLSVVVGGGVALLGFLVLHDKMLAILFGILALQNFLQLRNMGGFGGGGFGGGNYGGGGRKRPW